MGDVIKVTVSVELEIKLTDIQDLLCSALEGGSNYWYVIDEFVKPTTMQVRTDPKKVFRHLDYPVNPGGALIIMDKEDDDEKKRYRLDLESIEKGLKTWAEKYPKSFARFRDEDYDANDGDLFLQCCLFGEAVYG